MNPVLRRWGRRLLIGLVFGPVLAWSTWTVGAGATLGRIPFPAPTPALGPAPAWGVTLAAVLVPAAALSAPKEGQGGVGLVSLAAGALVPAAYPWSSLDWSVLLVDLGLTQGGVPPLGVVAAGLAPLGLAWVLHAAALSRQTRIHYEAKGADGREAAEAGRVAGRWALAPAFGALAGTSVLVAGYRLLPAVPSPNPAWAPLVVAAVTVAAVALALRRAGPTGG